MTPWELVHAHKYEEAISVYRSRLIVKPNDSGTLAEMGTALMCIGQFQEALHALQKASAINAKELKGSSAYLNDVATIQWLLGMKHDSKQTLRRSVDGILDRSIVYADSAGGVSQGLQLWYASVTTDDAENQEYAIKYLKKLAKHPRVKKYPGSIARYVLLECDFSTVLKDAVGAEDLNTCLNVAKNDLLKRRQLCQALFYDAVLARSRGKEEECISKMRQCFSLENPINEMEWYLARAECSMNSTC